MDQADGPLIPPEVWDRAARDPGPDCSRFSVVHDPDLGTIAELTTPTGRRFYGADGPTNR